MKKNMAVVRFCKHLDAVVEIVSEKEMSIERHGVSDALVLCRFNDGKLEFIPKDHLDNMDYDPIDWEQRRYEIAKDLMAGIISNEEQAAYARVEAKYEKGEIHTIPKAISRYAIALADGLIEELKKDKQG